MSYKDDIKLKLDHAIQKRSVLLSAFQRKLKWRRMATVASGLLSLMSGTAATTIFLEVFDHWSLKVFTAIAALLSAIISAISEVYLSDTAKDVISEGANDYLEVIDKYRKLMLDEEALTVSNKNHFDAEIARFKQELEEANRKYREVAKKTDGEIPDDENPSIRIWRKKSPPPPEN